ncbi:iron-sulfur cluster assembly protein 1-like [Olea europaea var. sylvestris]|uniref:iron-sulfur cluster assembly protein 1-like n=1 Tax=Olea europaea var. sylvestris TaxID=158386 RepID=UPI000C1CFB40|nr:iron-sulfur cluster assembly protein 1-like [Olea europaea var. sylvestris]
MAHKFFFFLSKQQISLFMPCMLLSFVGCKAILLTKVSFSATEWVKGKQMEEVLSIKNTEIAKHLSLPPVKLHCSMLAEDAIKAAVKDYETKRAKPNSSEEAAPVEKAADA